MRDIFPQFPHCDARILHAPGECEFCDEHPDWQELRKTWMIAFTGHEPVTYDHAGTQVPCPADFNRPPSGDADHRRWAGNVATTAEPVNETGASKLCYGNLWSDFEEVEVQPATVGGKVGRWLQRRKEKR